MPTELLIQLLILLVPIILEHARAKAKEGRENWYVVACGTLVGVAVFVVFAVSS